jgi:hypothetical protein
MLRVSIGIDLSAERLPNWPLRRDSTWPIEGPALHCLDSALHWDPCPHSHSSVCGVMAQVTRNAGFVQCDTDPVLSLAQDVRIHDRLPQKASTAWCQHALSHRDAPTHRQFRHERTGLQDGAPHKERFDICLPSPRCPRTPDGRKGSAVQQDGVAEHHESRLPLKEIAQLVLKLFYASRQATET